MQEVYLLPYFFKHVLLFTLHIDLLKTMKVAVSIFLLGVLTGTFSSSSFSFPVAVRLMAKTLA